MGFLNLIMYASIATMYNIFVHHMTSIMYKDLAYQERHNKTSILLLLSGIGAIVIAKMIMDETKKYNNSIVSYGLFLGGIILIITTILANWQDMTDKIKLISSGMVLLGLIWYAYKYQNREENKKIDKKTD